MTAAHNHIRKVYISLAAQKRELHSPTLTNTFMNSCASSFPQNTSHGQMRETSVRSQAFISTRPNVVIQTRLCLNYPTTGEHICIKSL